MKKVLPALLIIFVLIFGALLIVPSFVDLGTLKSSYLPMLEEAIHRRIDVDGVRLTLVPAPSIRLSNLKISDSPTISDHTFFAAQQIQLRLRLWPLLRGRFEVTEFFLDRPVINLLTRPDGTFNYSDMADRRVPATTSSARHRNTVEPRAQAQVQFPFFVPARMRIKEGQLNLGTKGEMPLRIEGIDLSLQDFTGDRPFPYRASFNYPGLKTVSLEGRLSYQDDEAKISLEQNRIKIRELTLPIEGSVTHLSSIPRIDLRLSSEAVEAKVIFEILSVLGLAPRETDISGPMGLKINIAGHSNSLVAHAHGVLKDVRVNGKRAVKGKFKGEVFITLPLGVGSPTRRLQGNGRLAARDGELTNVVLIKRVQRATGMIGLTKEQGRQATTFKTLETEFSVADGFADFKRIYLINPQMEVNGDGLMTLERPSLNMAVETTLSAQASARAGRGRTVAFLKDTQGRVVVPLRITGPVENPAVNLDTEKLAQRGMPRSMEKSYGSFFKGLFRR